jgi:hypothetical protein
MHTSLVRWSFLAAFVVAAALSRVYQPVPNFTAIGALAVISAIAAPRAWMTFFLTWAAMLMGDLLLAQQRGTVGWSPELHSYIGFGLVAALAMLARREPRFWKAATAGLAGGLVFFLYSNGVVWVQSAYSGGASPAAIYPADMGGLIECYLAGVPFYRSMLQGDLLFLPLGYAAMVGVMALERRLAAAPAEQKL